MRRQITWLVVATTSAIVASFILPLCLLVRNLVEDRVVSAARQEAQSVATVVASVTDPSALAATVDLFVTQGSPVTVVTADGTTYGFDAADVLTHRAVATARQERTAMTEHTAEGVDIVIPVATDRGITVVVTTVPTADLRDGVARAWAAMAGLGLALIAASTLAASRLGRRISVPVTDLAHVADRLRAGDHSARARVAGPTETQGLAVAFNQLADRIDVLVADAREGAADLGHRLRTPVTALRLDTDLIADAEVADRMREHVAQLQRGIDAVVRDARRHVRDHLPEGCRLAEVAIERADFWLPLAEDQGRAFAVHDSGSGARVGMTGADVAEVVDTLLDNVFAHTPEGAAIALTVALDGDDVVLVVADGGPGATASDITRGASRSGSTGLGLDIVRRLVASGGGTLRLTRAELGGLAAVVRLPRAAG